jgi:cytochrome oxidase Cu insertion factor (SCO1/SenC/PrrC family)
MNFKNAAAITLLTVSLSCATKLNSTLSRADELKPRNSPLQVGEIAPDFTLENQNNQKVTLSSARGSRPTVLVFYRGNW